MANETKWNKIKPGEFGEFGCEYVVQGNASGECVQNATWRHDTRTPEADGQYGNFLCAEHYAMYMAAHFESDYEPDGGNYCRWEGYPNADKAYPSEGFKKTTTDCNGMAKWKVKGSKNADHYFNVRLCDKHKAIMDERKRAKAEHAGWMPVQTTAELKKATKEVKFDEKIDKLLVKFAGTPRARRIEVERELYGAEECYNRLKREALV